MSIFREHKSSINFKKVKSIYYSLQHNRREKKPSYLLPKDLVKRENDFSELKDKKSPNMLAFLRKVFDENMKIYEKNKQGKGGNKPRFENTLQEAIVNIREDTTKEQLFKVFGAIIETTGYQPVAMYSHFDEGYLVDKNTLNNPKPTCLVAGKDYWVDTDGKAYHIINRKSGKYTKEKPLDTLKYVAKMNPHCHILLSSFNNGVQRYGKVTRQQLSQLQTRVAEILGMERGQKATGRKHISHQQYKEIKARENELNDREIELNKRENRLNVKEKQIQQNTQQITLDEYNALVEHSSQVTNFLKKSNEIVIKEIGKVIRFEMKEQGGFSRSDYADLEKMQTKMYVANNDMVVNPDDIFSSFREFSSRYKIQPQIETKLKELENQLKNENNTTISTTQYGR